MGAEHKYYDVDDFNRWKRSQGNKIPPRENLLAAANWVCKFFEARKTDWAALGSLAILCLGSRREIPDIHVVYDDREFSRIVLKLETDPRVRLPKGMNSMFSSKLLISTGPKFKDPGCSTSADVEVEIIPPGSNGTPPSDIWRNNQVLLKLDVNGKATKIKGLNVLWLVKSTVHLCNSADLLWDPKKDLLWLCRKFGAEIEATRRHLNARQVQENFLGTQYFSTLSTKEQRLCYQVLLGKEPPPSMLLTPAPPQGQSTAGTTRPAFSPFQSAPTLGEHDDQKSGFLRPPMPGKVRSAAAQPNTLASNVSGSEMPRDSRTRSRTSSAPTTPSASRNASPDAAVTPLRTRAHSENQQKHVAILQAQSVNVALRSKPQVVSHRPVSYIHQQTGLRTQKSLPNKNSNSAASSAVPVPVFAHKDTSPATRKLNAVSATTSTSSEQKTGLRTPDHSIKARNKTSTAAPALGNQPQNRTYTHPAHEIVKRMSMLPPSQKSSAPVTALVPVKSSAAGIQPFVGSADAESSPKALAVVGPEGVYAKSNLTVVPAQPPKSQRQTPPAVKHQPRASLAQFVFELDACAPAVELPTQTPSPIMHIAELPGDNAIPSRPAPTMDTSLRSIPESPISPPQEPKPFVSGMSYQDAPVSPPETQRPFASLVQSQYTESKTQFPKLDPVPASMDVLPPSLMIGVRRAQGPSENFAASRERASSQSSSSSSSTRKSSSSPSAKKYRRYYTTPPASREASPQSHPASAPNSRGPSPNRGPSPKQETVMVYKAYTPPITPPMHPMQSSIVPTPFQEPRPMLHHHATEPLMHQHNHLPPMPQRHAPIPPAPQRDAPSIPAPQCEAPKPPIQVPASLQTAAQRTRSRSPPASLKINPDIPHPLRPARSHFPNPLGANPPTPKIQQHAKHDSHHHAQLPPQNHQQPPPPVLAPSAFPHPGMPTRTQTAPHPAILTVAHQPQKPRQSFIAYQPPPSGPTHARNTSTDSNSSTASHDSEKLAQEYQMDLPAFGAGYGGMTSSSATPERRQTPDSNPERQNTDSPYRLELPDFASSNQSGRFMDEWKLMLS